MSLQNIFHRKPKSAVPSGKAEGKVHDPAPGQARDTLQEDNGNTLLSGYAWGQLDRMQLNGNRFLQGAGLGVRPSTRRKATAEFREHRKYVPGDDVRFVDWKASARQEQIFLKQGENPRDTAVGVLLDNSASMEWAGLPREKDTAASQVSRRHTALGLVSVLGYLALAHGDRLTVASLDGKHSWGPVTGKGQFPALLKFLWAIPFGSPNHFLEATRTFARSSGSGGLVYILSDLWEVTRLGEALAELPAPKWQATLFHLLHSEELEPALKGDLELVDIETGEKANYDIDARALAMYQERMQAWLNQVEQTCLDKRVLYARLPSDEPVDRVIVPQLRILGVIEPV